MFVDIIIILTYRGVQKERDEQVTYIPLAPVLRVERMWTIWVKRYYFFIEINIIFASSIWFCYKNERKMVHL